MSDVGCLCPEEDEAKFNFSDLRWLGLGESSFGASMLKSWTRGVQVELLNSTLSRYRVNKAMRRTTQDGASHPWLLYSNMGSVTLGKRSPRSPSLDLESSWVREEAF
ncbi:hypothetical protein SAY86_002673 [Trapa natans]|uniref:Uncharacterized protein n=1 Tax=Trapa natans TaxID=22666 RepID=A0AAN7LKM3_TRANT|nr:hypothetical protein SAY86_002673 [Trapa natans]